MEIDGLEKIQKIDAEIIDERGNLQPDETFKLILIGSAGVGKSSILLRATANKFSEEHNATLGVEFGSLLLRMEGKIIRLQTWDTGGMESFRSLTRIFYKGAQCVLVVYEISNPASFSTIEEWLEEARQFAGSDIKVFLIANKCDLANK